MRNTPILIPLAATLISLSLAGCNSSAPPEQAAASALAPAPFSTVADMKQVMNWILEPNADVVWEAVGTIVTAEGEQSLLPKTEEEWEHVRNSAATVAEFGNLLMLDSRARDRGAWMAMARALIDTSNEAVKAAEAKDAEQLFTAGGDMYLACTACHAAYVIGMPHHRVEGLEEPAG